MKMIRFSIRGPLHLFFFLRPAFTSLLRKLAFAPLFAISFFSCTHQDKIPEKGLLDHPTITIRHFGTDTSWYLRNIPFFECSDKMFEEVYYYRWKMYKAHIRDVGNFSVITEFINHVPWDREPFCTINAASMHHIYEGRWLRDPIYMDDYIRYLFDGGNDRRYSESVADAAYNRYLVDVDREFVVSMLDSMISVYNGWADHWVAEKNLYYIPAMPDATEFTIASIDASGGKGGFEGGEAFRPTINSYMYGTALAISGIADLAGKTAIKDEFLAKAKSLKSRIQEDLWNDSLQHFCDRYQVENKYVHYWDFIRGRELAGYAPWYFNLPDDNETFARSWQRVLDTSGFQGKYGFRTQEPSYEYYFVQFLWHEGKRGSQWNGPSWPYQSSQALTAMANLLHFYTQHQVSKSDYLQLLRKYARQHYLPDGTLNLVENYDPNLGGPIVNFAWSKHYNHSTFNNLIISGLCGILPDDNDTLVIDPLTDNSITYFCLENLVYHGHNLTVVYDADGKHYGLDSGLTVFSDGKKLEPVPGTEKLKIVLPPPVKNAKSLHPINLALNVNAKGYPSPDASVNNQPEQTFQALDGRAWYFPEITNGWTTHGSANSTDWFEIDFGKEINLTSIVLHPVVYGEFGLPATLEIEIPGANGWKTVAVSDSGTLVANTGNRFQVKTTADKIRLKLFHPDKQAYFSEIEVFGE